MRCLFALIFIGCVSCSAVAASPNRIAAALTNADIRAVSDNTHRLARPRFDEGEIDPAFHLDHVMMLIRPSAAQQADLDQLLRDQQNPSSSRFHQWLTPEQYADRFGLSLSDYSKIVSWLTVQGLTIN